MVWKTIRLNTDLDRITPQFGGIASNAELSFPHTASSVASEPICGWARFLIAASDLGGWNIGHGQLGRGAGTSVIEFTCETLATSEVGCKRFILGS